MEQLHHALYSLGVLKSDPKNKNNLSKENIMKSSTLIFACLFGLLFFIYQQQAIAFPSSSVSYGQNPIVNIGGTGTAYDNETKSLLSAPINQDIIVTDIILTSFTDICKL